MPAGAEWRDSRLELQFSGASGSLLCSDGMQMSAAFSRFASDQFISF